MLLLSVLLIIFYFGYTCLIHFYFCGAFSAITRTASLQLFFQSHHNQLTEFILGDYTYFQILLVDTEQWRTEIGNFNECLHCAINRSEINILNIMVRIFKAKKNVHFFIITFVFVLFNCLAIFSC